MSWFEFLFELFPVLFCSSYVMCWSSLPLFVLLSSFSFSPVKCVNVCLSVCALPPLSFLFSHISPIMSCVPSVPCVPSLYNSCSSCSSYSCCFHVPCVPCISSVHRVPAYVPSSSLVSILLFLFFLNLFYSLDFPLPSLLILKPFVVNFLLTAFCICILYFFCFYWTLHHRFMLIKLALFSPAYLWLSCIWVLISLWYSCIHDLRVTNTTIIVKDEFDW